MDTLRPPSVPSLVDVLAPGSVCLLPATPPDPDLITENEKEGLTVRQASPRPVFTDHRSVVSRYSHYPYPSFFPQLWKQVQAMCVL